MVRLQRVTFIALHNYLGLSWQLVDTSSLHYTKRNPGDWSSTFSGIGATGTQATYLSNSPTKLSQRPSRVSVVHQHQQANIAIESESCIPSEQSEIKSCIKVASDFESNADD